MNQFYGEIKFQNLILYTPAFINQENLSKNFKSKIIFYDDSNNFNLQIIIPRTFLDQNFKDFIFSLNKTEYGVVDKILFYEANKDALVEYILDYSDIIKYNKNIQKPTAEVYLSYIKSIRKISSNTAVINLFIVPQITPKKIYLFDKNFDLIAIYAIKQLSEDLLDATAKVLYERSDVEDVLNKKMHYAFINLINENIVESQYDSIEFILQMFSRIFYKKTDIEAINASITYCKYSYIYKIETDVKQ